MDQQSEKDNQPLQDSILEILSILKEGTADEIAMEIMERKGISSEEGVADLTMDTKKELKKLCEAGKVKMIRTHGAKKRYTL